MNICYLFPVHQLYARKFSLITDHKPLTAIFGPKKGIPTLPAARLQHWAILLSPYRYDIVYCPTKLHANTDALSRIPLHSSKESHSVCYDSIFNLGQIEALHVTCGKLANTDPLLSKVMRYTRHG